jgi:hypothetical protein
MRRTRDRLVRRLAWLEMLLPLFKSWDRLVDVRNLCVWRLQNNSSGGVFRHWYLMSSLWNVRAGCMKSEPLTKWFLYYSFRINPT